MMSVVRHAAWPLLLVGIILTLVGSQPPRIVGFPQYEGPLMLAEWSHFGELIVVDGCLRVRRYPDRVDPKSYYQPSSAPLLLIWPANFALSFKGSSIQIIDGAGLIAARVGDEVRFSGHPICSDGWCLTTDIGEIDLLQPLPEGCPGPYWIVGEEVSAVAPDEPTVVSIPGSTLWFPRQKSVKGPLVQRTALNGGELILDGDCLRVGRPDVISRNQNPNLVVVWPAGFTPHIEEGVVHIRNGAGRIIARVGDKIYMGGGETWFKPKGTDSERCPGKYWIAHNVRHPSKFEVIVENRSEDAVVVYVSGRRLGSKDEDEIIEGCSTKRFGPKSWFAPKPTRDLRVSVYDSHGVDRRQILETRVSPKFPEDSSDDWYVEVVVPGAAGDECQ